MVEDEGAVRSLVVTVLRRQGYSVLQAANGEEALGVAERHHGPIHLLLSDATLPGISGPQVGAQIVEGHPETKVMFMSGYSDQTMHEGLSSGAAFLPKPFTPDVLVRRVREALAGVAGR